MIAIIDYGSGNVSSVKNSLDFLGVESKITSKPEEIGAADKIIFPGVGAFGYAMEQLAEKKLEGPIKNAIKNGKPFLGICLGLQLLFGESEENPGVKGLGIFRGKSKKFSSGKTPQIGWNEIKPTKNGILREGFMYFVNSYYVVPEDKGIVAAESVYGNRKFACAVENGNVMAVQFHAEKSGEFGLDFLRRWVDAR